MNIETQEKKSEKKSLFKKPWVQSVLSIVVIFGVLAAFLYYAHVRNTISIENSYLDAPIANISPIAPGLLNAVYVHDGDRVAENTPVALVGSETLYSKDEGIVSSAPRVLGSYFTPGQPVVSVIADQHMTVVGSIEENKGLNEISPGQHATFTVDAFPGTTYQGTVDEVSPSSNDTGVVFSISDKRPVKKFDIRVRFDVSKYPELKNGMSAKIKVYTKM